MMTKPQSKRPKYVIISNPDEYGFRPGAMFAKSDMLLIIRDGNIDPDAEVRTPQNEIVRAGSLFGIDK